MKLDDFIKKVLVDINNGINEASSATDRSYMVEISSNRGVHFDIAVTTRDSLSGKASSEDNSAVVEVLGKSVNVTEVESHNEQSDVNRIQFTVYVPSKTNTDHNSSMRELAKNTVDFNPY